jgi:hypothetical protein
VCRHDPHTQDQRREKSRDDAGDRLPVDVADTSALNPTKNRTRVFLIAHQTMPQMT